MADSNDVFHEAARLERADRGQRLRAAALEAIIASPTTTLGDLVKGLGKRRGELAEQMATLTIGEIIDAAVEAQASSITPPRSARRGKAG